MHSVVEAIDALIGLIPMPLLEVWGRLAFFVGLALAIAAFGGFTFRPGGRWGVGREQQAWDTTAILSIPLTFVLIVLSGYVGSFVVLVPGAQTLESLKDLVVLLCIVLFGYPALITVPFAYGLSDMIEGVPPSFILDWLPGYFINPACFWIAYQLIGKNPDFRRLRTWGAYLVFVVLFAAIEPVLWGHICADKFTPEVSYRTITSALFFTTSLTWVMAPTAMLGAFPLARRLGLYWAEIPGHVRERLLGSREWIWEAGHAVPLSRAGGLRAVWPIQLAIVAPFVALILLSVGATAYVSLRSAQQDATKLASQLHREISAGIDLRLDDYFAGQPAPASVAAEVSALIAALPVAEHGLAAIIDGAGRRIAVSPEGAEPTLAVGLGSLKVARRVAAAPSLASGLAFQFDVVSEKPLARETWLALAKAYQDERGDHSDWVIVTAMPESYFLAGVKIGNSRSAVMFALALLLTILAAALLAGLVTKRLRRLSFATHALARGDLTQRLDGSRLEELGIVAQAFNDMAEKLARSFDALSAEVRQRGQAEEELGRLNTSLERRVAERTEELEAALVRAEAADRTKSAFLATMSHELRTPLNSIIGFTGIVLQGMAGPLTAEQAKQLGMVRGSARHLLDLINDVLDISKIEAGQMQVHLQPVELRPLLDRALAAIGPLAQKKGLALESELDPAIETVLSDARRLEQILLNLLNNGVKFTEQGSVKLVAKVERDSASGRSQVRLSVTDTGCGIKPEEVPTLFQPFHQLSTSLARQHEGTGLGLAISRRLATLLGGEISVESEWGKGCTFSVVLPLDAA